MKKILFSFIATSSLLVNINASDFLQGDTKLACEAILCLSSATRPGECNSALRKYFSIKAKKWHETVTKRRNFLKLCPVGGVDIKDKEFARLRDEVLPNIDVRKCTPQALNERIARKIKRIPANNKRGYIIVYYYQINSTLPRDCEIIMKHDYSNIRPRYVCDNNIWYSSSDWYQGYKSKTITKDEYTNIVASSPLNAKEVNGKYISISPINKKCWVDENAE